MPRRPPKRESTATPARALDPEDLDPESGLPLADPLDDRPLLDRQTRGEFDEIAAVYDQTRTPLDPGAGARLAETLRSRAGRRILEVGVGTGRIAAPLARLGLDVTGVDAAPRMLAQARTKGLGRLVRGNADALPFHDGSFDAAIFAHVLHTLERPEDAIAEAHRVSRRGVFALLTGRSRVGRGAHSPEGDELRRMLREELAREGIVLPPRRDGGPSRRERLLLRRFPPTELLSLGERTVQLPASRRLSWVEARADRQTLRLPPEAVQRAVARVRARLPTETQAQTVPIRHTYELVRWASPGSLPEPRPDRRSDIGR
jgi:SAM-dependent methyltransferase